MALRKIEISDELLNELGVAKSPKELGEAIESYVKTGMECVRFSKDNIALLNIIFDISSRLGKEKETNKILKEMLKEINLKLMSEV